MKLKKSLGKKTIFLLTTKATIGTGIFFLPALAAGISGPSSIIAWMLMGIVAIFISMYFAELISMYPKSGGVYEFTRKAFGEMPSFFIGWTAWIISNVTISMLIVGSLLYLFPSATFDVLLFLAITINIIFNYVSFRGVDLSAKILLFFSILTIAALALIIFPGIPKVNFSTFSSLVFVPGGILLSIYFIAETFFGWETASYLAEETKNARKVLPKILVLSTIAVVALSLLVTFVSLGVTNTQEFATSNAPLSLVSSKIFGSGFSPVFSIVVFFTIIGTAAAWIISSPRLLYAMSRDRILPFSFKKIHSKYRTPYFAILFQAIVTSIVTILALGNFRTILMMLIPFTMILYSAVLLAFFKLRISKPNAKRYFKAPLPVVSIIIIVLNIWMLYTWISTPGAFWLFYIDIFLILFSIPFYLLIKLQSDRKFVENFYDRISFCWDHLFPIWYGKKEVGKVVRYANLKSHHNVLDFGCGTGITTFEIARRVEKGNVLGYDISHKQIEKAQKKLERIKLDNISFEKTKNKKFKKNSFDSVTAVGVIEHLENPEKMLKNLFFVLKPKGTFSFLVFGKSFNLPSPQVMAEGELKKILDSLPVQYTIRKEKKKFTEYYYVYGKKN